MATRWLGKVLVFCLISVVYIKKHDGLQLSDNLHHLVVIADLVDDNLIMELVATDGNAELTCPLPAFTQLAKVIKFDDPAPNFLDSRRHKVSSVTMWLI